MIFSWYSCFLHKLCDKVCQWLAAGLWFSPGTPVSSTNYVIKFVSDLRQVSGSLLVLLFPPQIMWSSLSATCRVSVVFSWYSYFLHKLCDQVCQWLAGCQWFSPGTPVSSTNYVIKFVSDLRQVSGFLLVLLYPPQIMWSSLSVTCGRSVVFSRYSVLLHQ